MLKTLVFAIDFLANGSGFFTASDVAEGLIFANELAVGARSRETRFFSSTIGGFLVLILEFLIEALDAIDDVLVAELPTSARLATELVLVLVVPALDDRVRVVELNVGMGDLEREEDVDASELMVPSLAEGTRS